MKNFLWIWFFAYSVIQPGIFVKNSEHIPDDIISIQEYNSFGEFQSPEESSLIKLAEQEEDEDEGGSSDKIHFNNSIQYNPHGSYLISSYYGERNSEKIQKIYLMNRVLII